MRRMIIKPQMAREKTKMRRPAAAKPPEKKKRSLIMFENLKKAIDKAEEGQAEKAYKRACDEDSALRELLTEKQWKKYKSGTMTREKSLVLARKKAEREAKKTADRYRERLTAAEGDNRPADGLLIIRFVRNQIWGLNPHAELLIVGETFTGRASGCGYDKASAAMAEALNACPAIMRALYEKEEERPDGVTRQEWIGYGSGYGVLPSFEGRVGVRTLCEVLTACGLSVNFAQASDETYYIGITEGVAKK